MLQSVPASTPLQRKKSLPDFQGLPKATDPMSREEVSVLSSARREEVRRQAEEAERLRANPLLYLVSPHVKVRWQLIVTQLIKKLLACTTPANILPRHTRVHILIILQLLHTIS